MADGNAVGGSLYVDTAIPFGLRSAPKIFTAVADTMEWMAKQEGVRFIVHYLDDFLVMGPPLLPECGEALCKLLEILDRLGLPVDGEAGGPYDITRLPGLHSGY